MGKSSPSIHNIVVLLVVLLLLVTTSESHADSFIRVKPPTASTSPPPVNSDMMKVTPRLEKKAPSSFNVETAQEAMPFPYLPGNETGSLIRQHFINAAAFGAESEAKFIDSLRELRTNKVEVIQILVQAYKTVESEQYFDRWLITNTLSQINAEETIEYLGQIAGDAIPPEKYDFNKMGRSSVAEEITIRLAAVRGLSTLARGGHNAADGALVRLAQEDVNSAVKRMAIQGYLEADFDIKIHKSWTRYAQSHTYALRMKYLKTIVPRKDLHLLDVRPVLPKDLDSLKVDFHKEKEKPNYKKSRLPDRSKTDPNPVIEGTPAYLETQKKQNETLGGGQ